MHLSNIGKKTKTSNLTLEKKKNCVQCKKEQPFLPPADVCEQRQILFLRYIPAAIHIGAKCPVPHTCRGRVCHCSRVTTSTACPSSVTVLSMRVAMGAMAT